MCYFENGFTIATFDCGTSPENLAYLNPYSTQLAFPQACAVFSLGTPGF